MEINLCTTNTWILGKIAFQIARQHGTDHQVHMSYFRAVDSMANFYIDIFNCLQSKYLGIKGHPHVGFYTHDVVSLEELEKKTGWTKLDGIVTMDQLHADRIKEYGYQGKLEIITPGNFHKAFHISPLKLFIPYRGDINSHYGQKFLIEFVNKYPRIRDLDFVFIGQGWEAAAKKINDVGSHAEHYPDSNDDDPTWYPKMYQIGYDYCDYVLVTIEETAGPLCLPEALACGKPVITTEVGLAMNEFQDDDAVITYPVGNYEALAQILDSKLVERDRVRDLAYEAHGRSLDWKTYARSVVEFIANECSVS